MSPAGILAQLDKVEASFKSADALARIAKLGDGPGLLAAAADLPFILAMGASVLAMPGLAGVDKLSSSIYSGFFAALDAYFAASTAALLFAGKPVTTLDLYASYQNNAARDSFLIGPNCAHLYFLSRQSAPTGLLTATNVFAPVTTFGAGAVGASAAITFTPGVAPNSIPSVNVGLAQGYTPASGITATVAAAIGGTLTITVTGTGRTSGGALVSGRTWTGVLDGAAAGTVVALTPSVAGDRIASVSSVSGTGTATAGSFTLMSIIERVVS